MSKPTIPAYLVWTEIPQALGEAMWGDRIAKGSVVFAYPDGSEILIYKADGQPPSYFKRTPTGSGATKMPAGTSAPGPTPTYRYHYADKHTDGGLGGAHFDAKAHPTHFNPGSKHAGFGGHYTVHAADPKAGTVTVSHSLNPKVQHTFKTDHFAEHLKQIHAPEVEKHKQRTLSDMAFHEQGVKHHQERASKLREAAIRHGYMDAGAGKKGVKAEPAQAPKGTRYAATSEGIYTIAPHVQDAPWHERNVHDTLAAAQEKSASRKWPTTHAGHVDKNYPKGGPTWERPKEIGTGEVPGAKAEPAKTRKLDAAAKRLRVEPKADSAKAKAAPQDAPAAKPEKAAEKKSTGHFVSTPLGVVSVDDKSGVSHPWHDEPKHKTAIDAAHHATSKGHPTDIIGHIGEDGSVKDMPAKAPKAEPPPAKDDLATNLKVGDVPKPPNEALTQSIAAAPFAGLHVSDVPTAAPQPQAAPASPAPAPAGNIRVARPAPAAKAAKPGAIASPFGGDDINRPITPLPGSELAKMAPPPNVHPNVGGVAQATQAAGANRAAQAATAAKAPDADWGAADDVIGMPARQKALIDTPRLDQARQAQMMRRPADPSQQAAADAMFAPAQPSQTPPPIPEQPLFGGDQGGGDIGAIAQQVSGARAQGQAQDASQREARTAALRQRVGAYAQQKQAAEQPLTAAPEQAVQPTMRDLGEQVGAQMAQEQPATANPPAGAEQTPAPAPAEQEYSEVDPTQGQFSGGAYTNPVPQGRVEHELPSTNIRHMAWEPDKAGSDRGKVRVHFRDGSVYDYADVHHGDYDKVVNHPESHGKEFLARIHGAHPHTQVRAATPEGKKEAAEYKAKRQAEINRAKEEAVNAQRREQGLVREPPADRPAPTPISPPSPDDLTNLPFPIDDEPQASATAPAAPDEGQPFPMPEEAAPPAAPEPQPAPPQETPTRKMERPGAWTPPPEPATPLPKVAPLPPEVPTEKNYAPTRKTSRPATKKLDEAAAKQKSSAEDAKARVAATSKVEDKKAEPKSEPEKRAEPEVKKEEPKADQHAEALKEEKGGDTAAGARNRLRVFLRALADPEATGDTKDKAKSNIEKLLKQHDYLLSGSDAKTKALREAHKAIVEGGAVAKDVADAKADTAEAKKDETKAEDEYDRAKRLYGLSEQAMSNVRKYAAHSAKAATEAGNTKLVARAVESAVMRHLQSDRNMSPSDATRWMKKRAEEAQGATGRENKTKPKRKDSAKTGSDDDRPSPEADDRTAEPERADAPEEASKSKSAWKPGRPGDVTGNMRLAEGVLKDKTASRSDIEGIAHALKTWTDSKSSLSFGHLRKQASQAMADLNARAGAMPRVDREAIAKYKRLADMFSRDKVRPAGTDKSPEGLTRIVAKSPDGSSTYRIRADVLRHVLGDGFDKWVQSGSMTADDHERIKAADIAKGSVAAAADEIVDMILRSGRFSRS